MAYERILTALADTTRREIFEDLRRGPQSVSELAKGRAVSRPAVSQHLKVLDQAGLVSAEARGTARIYRLNHAGLAPLRAYVDTFWTGVLDAFAAEISTQMENSDASTRDQDD